MALSWRLVVPHLFLLIALFVILRPEEDLAQLGQGLKVEGASNVHLTSGFYLVYLAD